MNHDKIYTERIEIKVSKKMKKLLEEVCEIEGLTLNQFIRNCINSEIK